MYILLVEDNLGDILLTTETLEEGKIANRISVVKDGKEAINFLSKNGNYSNADLPDLILLDINLPKINGYEVLQYIKASENLKQVPVVILTTSSSQKDITFSNKNFADGYIIKPLELNDFLLILSKLKMTGLIALN
jgi:CheY-like chemotaxis protein